MSQVKERNLTRKEREEIKKDRYNKYKQGIRDKNKRVEERERLDQNKMSDPMSR